MRREIWILCLLLLTRSTTTQDISEDDGGIKDNDTLADGNQTEPAVTTISEGEDNSENVTTQAPQEETTGMQDDKDIVTEGATNVTNGPEGSSETEPVSTEGLGNETASTQAPSSESVASESPETEANSSAATASTASSTDAVTKTPDFPTSAPQDETTGTKDETDIITEGAKNATNSPEGSSESEPVNTDGPKNETASTEASSSESVTPEATASTGSSTDAVTTTPEATTLAASTASSAATTTTEIPVTETVETEGTTTSTPTAPTTEAATTQRTNKTRRPSKRPTPPQPDDNEEYGTYFDTYGCEHKTLQTGAYFFTATCTARCGRKYVKSKNGNPCLRPLRRSPRFNHRGKLCTLGSCHNGKCKGPFIGEVPCQKPEGTAQYYDDYDNIGTHNYYDEYDRNDDESYSDEYPTAGFDNQEQSEYSGYGHRE